MKLRRLVWAIILCFITQPALARLSADQLLLVSNQNLPESVELAKYYARVRNVPEAQILPLDLPKSEDILPQQYETMLATKVREYLSTEQGKKIKCVVLFYGVPLHINSRANSPEQRQELSRLRNVFADLEPRLKTLADESEKAIKKAGIEPRKIEGSGFNNSVARFESARQQLWQWQKSSDDAQLKKTITDELGTVVLDVSKYALEAVSKRNTTTANSTSQPTTTIAIDDLPKTIEEFNKLVDQRRDLWARDKVRRVVALRSGPFILAQTIQEQIEWLDEDQSDASVDSELSLVKEPDYPRYLYRRSTLSVEYADSPPIQVMTARIDGPNLQVARRIIDDAIATEQAGLTGEFVIDGRGIANDQPGTFGWYDELLRQAGVITSSKTSINVFTDSKPELLPAKSRKDVGLYIGWYSLQNYIPSCTFTRGAVAFHVASLELTDLRNPQSREWVPNLLKDGACVSIGAVSEPYLHSFPLPNLFFPTLMTGEWSLAEVYWMTTAFASWKQVLIGDPLYRPFAAHPALKVTDLPEGAVKAFRKIVEKYGLDR